MRDEDRFQAFIDEVIQLSGTDQFEHHTRRRKRNVRLDLLDHGRSPDANLSPRESFRVDGYDFVIEVLVSELEKRTKAYKEWRDKFGFIHHNIAEPNKRAVKIKIAVGNEGLKKINASGLSTEDQNDPVKLWSLFEDQLKVKVNFRIHRLELMRYKQGKEESLDDFINRCRQKAAECDFNQNEIAERIIELVIASTPFEAFQKDLLDTPKGYTVEDVLKEGRKYEAVVASRKSLSTLESQGSGTSVNAIKTTKSRKCGNCALSHPPRQCPAYYDKCKACGTKGHWAKCCRKTKGKTKFSDREHKQKDKPDKYHHKHYKRPTKTKQGQTNIHTVESDETDSVQSDDDSFKTQFDAITISTLNFQPLNRKEAYTNIDVICPHRPGKHKLKLKVDTGAEGNTLPLRTVRQMPCHCWVTIHAATTSLAQQGATSDNVPTIRSIQDLTTRYPDQFDTIGNFKMEATLHLKEDAQPSIDPPHSNLPSPAEILFGRPIRSVLPSNYLTNTLQCHEELHQTLLGRKDKMKENHDLKKAGPELPPLHKGQKIRVLDQESRRWKPGTVTKVGPEPRSYEVTTPNGARLRRNRSHLREMYSRNEDDQRHQSLPAEQQSSQDDKDA
ncbi:hypothetical protein HOLleu_01628 [Holothuria leucospilota]|uniref:CCHC-type domain-containing protein n=1 Tax=Holothuria leucospilota TaxID=206669 RepID=A0A9Q1HKD3_HOLLE|nr:hypothetical protein HOLleu_01628 [Holothuria leucospilota]